MSKTRAEIEAEIAGLMARLEHVAFDPAFTPAELVRWDPSLDGAVLHIKHYADIPEIAFDIWYMYYAWNGQGGLQAIDINQCFGRTRSNCMTAFNGKWQTNIPEGCMETFSVLRRGGCEIPKKLDIEKTTSSETPVWRYEAVQDFVSVAKCIRILGQTLGTQVSTKSETVPADLRCKDYDVTGVVTSPKSGPMNGSTVIEIHIPLSNPERFLLDQIFVATVTKLKDRDIVTDLYPLSTLYNEWKRDKEAARGLPPQRKTELDEAYAQIAELQAQMRVLMADREAGLTAVRDADRAKEAELSKQNERLREALNVAVQTPNLMGVVPSSATPALPAKATAAVSRSATSLTNATAAADPM
jgi:hypothetical protein